MARKTLIFALLALLAIAAHAQQFEWAKSYYGHGDNYVNIPRGLVADSEGNTYRLMQVSRGGTLDGVDPFEGITNYNYSMLLVKMSPNGQHLWHRIINPWERGVDTIGVTVHDLRMLGDTALMMMVDMSLPLTIVSYGTPQVQSKLYYLDTLLTSSETLMPTDSIYHWWVTAFITMGLDGSLLEQHFLQVTYLDSVGQHYVTGTISPLGIEKTACIIVNPVYSGYEADTVCAGDSLLWHGQWVTSGGLPLADTLQTVAGCDSIVSLQLTVLNVPRPSFTLETDCEHYRYSILGTFVGDTTGYALEWQATPPDATLAGQPWDSLSLSPSTTTTYRFAIEGRCPFDTSFILQPISWPVADMTVLPEVLSVDHLDFEAYDHSLNATTRHWWVDGRYAGDESVLYDRGNALEDSLLLTLVAVNEACADTLVRVIPITHAVVWAPNVFTPGGPDNNLFAPVLNESVAEELYIYNRQGLLVAHVEGDNPLWDGTHDGTPCSQGAYVWVMKFRDTNGKLHEARGSVTIIR